MAIHIANLSISSPDFAPGARIPAKFAEGRGNSEPRLVVTGIPEGTAELAVIVHDPDAPRPHGFTHATLYGLVPTDGTVDTASGRFGPNDAGRPGYVGPYPPLGHGDHHYYFWVYALSRPVTGTPTRGEFLDQYGDAIIEQNRLVGLFAR